MLPCILALCIQIGAGMSAAGGQDSGIWYMDGPQYPHTMHLDSPSFSAGVEGSNWRAGAAYLGKFGVDAAARGAFDPTLPISHWHGTGKVFGLYAEYVAHWHGFRVEAGTWLYRTTWQERIPDWYTPVYMAPGPGIPPSGWTPGYHPLDVSMDHTQVGAMGAIGYDVGRASFVLQVASAGDRGCDRSIVKAVVATASIRYSF